VYKNSLLLIKLGRNKYSYVCYKRITFCSQKLILPMKPNFVSPSDLKLGGKIYSQKLLCKSTVLPHYYLQFLLYNLYLLSPNHLIIFYLFFLLSLGFICLCLFLFNKSVLLGYFPQKIIRLIIIILSIICKHFSFL